MATPVIMAQEVGVLLQIAVNETGTSNNISTASNIYLWIEEPCGTVFRTLPMIASSDGLYALRITTATDFTYDGNYTLQLFAGFPDGSLFKSPKLQIYVGE